MAERSNSKTRYLTENLFRHESGKMISVLTGIFGSNYLQLAEDVVQDALIRALNSWPYTGIPENPQAWLMKTAKNLATDQLRREANFRRKQPEISAGTDHCQLPDEIDERVICDDQLRLMFICCHPVLPPESQSALALRTLCGFSPREIASAFLISEAAVSKRLTRARQRLRESQIEFEIPPIEELPARLDGVLEILYLLFSEGHKSSHGDLAVRSETCAEAIRLGSILVTHPVGARPRTHALMALMCLTAARLPARVDEQGDLLRLEDQDRGLWDDHLIQVGMHHLALSSGGNRASVYHLQAGIAACHTTATSDGTTDWSRILQFYERLMELSPSPIVELNRVVALSKVKGAQEAISALQGSDLCIRLANYHLLHAVFGELCFKIEDKAMAAAHFRKACELTENQPERNLLARRLEECL